MRKRIINDYSNISIEPEMPEIFEPKPKVITEKKPVERYFHPGTKQEITKEEYENFLDFLK